MVNPFPAIRGLLDLIHFSDKVRPVIDPMKHLTNKNIRGSEAALARSGVRTTPFRQEPKEFYDPYPPQSYWASEGYSKERGLGDAIHTTRKPAEGFYDISDDADKFLPLAREKVEDILIDNEIYDLPPNEVTNLVISEAMNMAKAAKYLGLQNRKGRPNVFTQFDPVVPEFVKPPEGQFMDILKYLETLEE
jgi:hypothetical protein